MNLCLAQAIPVPLNQPEGASLMWGTLIMAIPVLMVLIGMMLGFRALHDIRTSEGRLGGAGLATFAAGLLPAAAILIACGGGMVILAEEISPRTRQREDVWGTIGVLIGLGICFLMMRGMYRQATGWVRPERPEAAGTRSRLGTAAIVLTIAGAAGFLLVIMNGRQMDYMEREYGFGITEPIFGPTRQVLVLLDLMVLIAGLTCGVLARQEPAGKVCAWICGTLFVMQLVLFS